MGPGSRSKHSGHNRPTKFCPPPPRDGYTGILAGHSGSATRGWLGDRDVPRGYGVGVYPPTPTQRRRMLSPC